MTLAFALAGAGFITEANAKKVEGAVQRQKTLAGLCRRVQKALQTAQGSGSPNAWKEYSGLKDRLPRNLRSKY